MEGLILMTLFPLTYLVVSTNLFPIKAKLATKTGTIKEVLNAKGAKGVVAITSLQQVLTPTLLRKKGKISSKSNSSMVIEKSITPLSILGKKTRKRIFSSGNLHAND